MPCDPILSAPASFVGVGLYLPADLSRLPELADFAREQACLARMSEKAAGRLRLVLEELFTNVCVHGSGWHTAKGEAHRVDIHCELCVQDSLLHTTFSDTAPAFNPLVSSPVGPLLPLEDLPIGGQGLHLVRVLALDPRYVRKDDRNIFTFFLARE